MAGGIPLALLVLHRLADAPSPRRGVALGLALAAQALACAYYGIFAGLMVGYGVLFLAVSRGLWRAPRTGRAVAIAAATSRRRRPSVLPAVLRAAARDGLRAIARRRAAVFGDVAELSGVAGARARGRARARAAPGLRIGEVLFPGILALVCGAAGAALGLRAARHAGPSAGIGKPC